MLWLSHSDYLTLSTEHYSAPASLAGGRIKMAALWRNINIHIKASEFSKKMDCETPGLEIKRNGEGGIVGVLGRSGIWVKGLGRDGEESIKGGGEGREERENKGSIRFLLVLCYFVFFTCAPLCDHPCVCFCLRDNSPMHWWISAKLRRRGQGMTLKEWLDLGVDLVESGRWSMIAFPLSLNYKIGHFTACCISPSIVNWS